MHACLLVCVCTYACVRLSAQVPVRLSASCMSVCPYARACERACMRAYVCLCTCIDVYVYLNVRELLLFLTSHFDVCLLACIRLRMSVCVRTETCLSICLCVFMYVRMHACLVFCMLVCISGFSVCPYVCKRTHVCVSVCV